MLKMLKCLKFLLLTIICVIVFNHNVLSLIYYLNFYKLSRIRSETGLKGI